VNFERGLMSMSPQRPRYDMRWVDTQRMRPVDLREVFGLFIGYRFVRGNRTIMSSSGLWPAWMPSTHWRRRKERSMMKLVTAASLVLICLAGVAACVPNTSNSDAALSNWPKQQKNGLDVGGGGDGGGGGGMGM
jgi:hypothetical protein